ncbi:MAG: hypothetical protein ACXVNF_10330 [Neobacillus sp.]
MKINEYYRDTANLNLNGSIAALFPTIFIVGGNISFFQHKGIMVLTIPFLVYSLISFQLYLFKIRRSLAIGRKIRMSESSYQSIFDVKNLLVVYLNTQSLRLLLYFTDGNQAGEIKKCQEKKRLFGGVSKTYALYDFHGKVIGFFYVTGKKTLKIEVYTQKKVYLGCYEKKQISLMKSKKELVDPSGRFIGAVEGSRLYMDEHIFDSANQQVGRLRRGWMPLEWSRLFPEANTPVLSFKEGMSENDKLLSLSLLINAYFIER